MKEFIIKNKKGEVFSVYVDDEDFEKLKKFNWCIHKSIKHRYAVAHTNGIREYFKMHRVIMNVNDPKVFVDHKDRNGLNNQKSNLRLCTPSQNSCNKNGWGTSKYLGVHLRKNKKTYRATIKSNNKMINIGTYKSEIEAAKAYDLAALKYHGEFANLNFK